ncbi:hypothetical protein GCM10027569_48690 [Flindersiella endophytica]
MITNHEPILAERLAKVELTCSLMQSTDRSCPPLDQANIDTPPATEHRPSPHLVEDSDPDGCSPWSCRTGLHTDAQQAA